MLRVGLTGGIASGKSTVAAMLRDQDCLVLAADTLGHELLEIGQPAYNEVVREFGKEILGPAGAIDRQKLGTIVFANSEKRALLNQILHPPILDVVSKWFLALDRPGGPEMAFVEAALIIEAEYNKQLDRLVLCWCRPDQQFLRLRERGLTEDQAQRRIAAQLSMEEKRRFADDVIDCSSSLEETERQVKSVVEKLKKIALAGTSQP